MPRRTMSPPFRGAMIALVAIAIVVAGAWMTVWAALALHAGAVGAGVVQGLLQRRFGEGVGLPGIRVLTIATAFACSTALIVPLDAWLWWPFAVACAAAAALLVLAPAMALCDWAGLREPPARVSGAPGLSGPFPEDRGAADPWFDLGNTGCRARITVVGELGMGGPQTLAYTLDNGLHLPGEDSATSDDGRWWILRQDHGGGCFVVDVSERVVYAREGMATGDGMFAAGVLSAATLIAKGFSPRRYRLLPGGWWWPESEPDPPLGPRPLGPDDGEAMLPLTRPIIDRTRVLEARVPLAYLAAPEWAVADARGPLPLRLPGSGLDGVVWRADGKAALLPVASLADGSPAPAPWYLWRADASGAWFEPGRPGAWGIPGASPTRPVRLEAEHVWLCVGVGVEPSAGLEGWDSLSFDSTMTFGSMHWPLAARADGSIDHVDVPVSLHLRLRQSLTAAPDAVAIDAIEVDLPGDRVLGFVPEDPRHAALRPGEVRSFRCRFEGGELSGIAPLPRPLGSGRFVVLQAVDRGALASRLHLVDLDTGRVSVLERPVAALRPVASLGDTLAWVEVLGQRSAHARFDALQALRPVPPPGAWGGTHADEGCTLVLRPRRACLEPSACELRLRPPWTRAMSPCPRCSPGMSNTTRPPRCPCWSSASRIVGVTRGRGNRSPVTRADC